jgi:tetratricopeptide (TPR) repeat protein
VRPTLSLDLIAGLIEATMTRQSIGGYHDEEGSIEGGSSRGDDSLTGSGTYSEEGSPHSSDEEGSYDSRSRSDSKRSQSRHSRSEGSYSDEGSRSDEGGSRDDSRGSQHSRSEGSYYSGSQSEEEGSHSKGSRGSRRSRSEGSGQSRSEGSYSDEQEEDSRPDGRGSKPSHDDSSISGSETEDNHSEEGSDSRPESTGSRHSRSEGSYSDEEEDDARPDSGHSREEGSYSDEGDSQHSREEGSYSEEGDSRPDSRHGREEGESRPDSRHSREEGSNLQEESDSRHDPKDSPLSPRDEESYSDGGNSLHDDDEKATELKGEGPYSDEEGSRHDDDPSERSDSRHDEGPDSDEEGSREHEESQTFSQTFGQHEDDSRVTRDSRLTRDSRNTRGESLEEDFFSSDFDLSHDGGSEEEGDSRPDSGDFDLSDDGGSEEEGDSRPDSLHSREGSRSQEGDYRPDSRHSREEGSDSQEESDSRHDPKDSPLSPRDEGSYSDGGDSLHDDDEKASELEREGSYSDEEGSRHGDDPSERNDSRHDEGPDSDEEGSREQENSPEKFGLQEDDSRGAKGEGPFSAEFDLPDDGGSEEEDEEEEDEGSYSDEDGSYSDGGGSRSGSEEESDEGQSRSKPEISLSEGQTKQPPASESNSTENSAIPDAQQIGRVTQFMPDQVTAPDYDFNPENSQTENCASFAFDGDGGFVTGHDANAFDTLQGSSAPSLDRSTGFVPNFEDEDKDNEAEPDFFQQKLSDHKPKKDLFASVKDKPANGFQNDKQNGFAASFEDPAATVNSHHSKTNSSDPEGFFESPLSGSGAAEGSKFLGETFATGNTGELPSKDTANVIEQESDDASEYNSQHESESGSYGDSESGSESEKDPIGKHDIDDGKRNDIDTGGERDINENVDESEGSFGFSDEDESEESGHSRRSYLDTVTKPKNKEGSVVTASPAMEDTWEPGSVVLVAEKSLTSMLEESHKQPSMGERSVSSRKSSASRRSTMAKRDVIKAKRKRAIVGYTREQMTKLSQVPRSSIVSDDEDTASIPSQSDHQTKRKKRRGRVKVKTEALLELAEKVNGAMLEFEKKEKEGTILEKEQSKEIGQSEEQVEEDEGSLASRILLNFEELVGVLLQLSDEHELLSTFAKNSDPVAIDALKTLISHSHAIGDIFGQLNPIITNYLTEEMNEEMEDFIYGMNLIVEQLAEICYRAGEKQHWNARANTSYLTLLELLARDTLEVTCIYDDVDTPNYTTTKEIQHAWQLTGHDEEAQTLAVTVDLAMFRQICYEVMLSCDQWCPDTDALMDICAIEDMEPDEQPPSDEEMVPAPEAALQVLEKINGEYLTRISTMASVLRRILPPEVVTDTRMKDIFAKRSTAGPAGLSPSTLVSISSIPEDPDNEESLGVAGVGKTTLAAMVANHPDVRRFFRDGIAWVYIGPTELNYTRYVQCLQDLIGQLEVEEDEEPLFPELLHTPSESKTKRRRREEGFMIFVRETMVEFLEKKNVLIVLDDVCFDPDLDWFDFTPPEEPEEEEGSCVVMTTSRRRNLLPAADTVEVDMLDENEGIKLLVKESGALSKILISESPEIKSVVAECAGHALAVKSVGRWLNLKHASNGIASSSVEEIHKDVMVSMDRIVKHGSHEETDMMYEILNMSLSPATNGEPTNIIKLCFAAFVKVFCEKKYISDFALADATPIVPLTITEHLFEALLDLEEEILVKEGSLFHAKKKEAAALIPEALSALGVFKVIITFVEDPEEGAPKDGEQEEEKYYQIMHKIQQEYGEYLFEEDTSSGLADLVKDGERRWNKAFAQAYLAKAVNWDAESPDAGLDYALETMPSHLFRGGMLNEAANLLCNSSFVRGRLFALGRENGTRRQIKDCETLFELMMEKRAAGKRKYDPKGMIEDAYETLGDLLYMDEDDLIAEEGSPEAVEVGRSHFDVGFSLAENRCWDAAIFHWEKSQELLVSALGMVELVAGVLFNVGVVYGELNEYEQALGSLKQCLKIRGAIHGEEHILYAQTIQKIGDVFLSMSDYHEAMESYNWALDVMQVEPSHHRIDIGDILENLGNIHYSKGEIAEALKCFQDALRSKQVDLGEDHPELSTTFQNIGNCLSDQGKTEEAIAHFEEAIRLKNLDPEGGGERDADVLTIEGILHNLHGRQQEGLECYEKALQVLVTKAPHRKEKVASLLHLIGCVYLMSGEQKKAMKLFEESLQARRKVLGFVHLDVASTLFNMAFLHQSRNRLDKALKCLEEALKIRQLRLPDSEKVAVTHEKIGNLARAVGKSKKAEIAFGEALRIRKLVHGEDHEAVATVLQELGDLNEDLGDYDTAMKNYVRALEIRESRLGQDDLAVAETYYSMGFTLQNNQASDRALQCFEESLSIRKFQLGDDSKEVGDVSFLFSVCGEAGSESFISHSILFELPDPQHDGFFAGSKRRIG